LIFNSLDDYPAVMEVRDFLCGPTDAVGSLHERHFYFIFNSLDDYPAVMEVRDFWKSPSSADQLMLSAAYTNVIFNDPSRRKVGAKPRPPSSGERADVCWRMLTYADVC
jgi:hypothetical protein